MPWRIYNMRQKYRKKDGTLSIYKLKNRKWINSNKPYKPQKRGSEKPSLWSKHFGFLDLYNRKEQQQLTCPSGYTISQCFNVLRKLWYGYHKARGNDKDIQKMKKYAKAIQKVQEDMGIKTTSFPHLGLYGDVLVLKNKENKRLVFEDHSALKQKMEAYKKWQVENAKKIQELLQKPDMEKGQEIVYFADDEYPTEEEQQEITVPHLLEPDEEKGQERIVIADDTAFQNNRKANQVENAKKIQQIPQMPSKEKREREEIVTFADDKYPYEMEDNEETVTNLLEPDEENGEEVVTIADDIPFRKP